MDAIEQMSSADEAKLIHDAMKDAFSSEGFRYFWGYVEKNVQLADKVKSDYKGLGEKSSVGIATRLSYLSGFSDGAKAMVTLRDELMAMLKNGKMPPDIKEL